ncbi:glycoside hydrolase family 30 protein [Blautia sp.]|uniref:glycoside hydrolase family 30 protein n=1 Tax=Blautia sp. TaxID=1955243 RepID=UPI00263760DA|nr:glycoside hydrolase family 30 beta sandwich domain-containing protein [Blautia sp.]
MKLELFTTYGTGTWQEQFHQVVSFQEDKGSENQVVNLYPDVKFETIEGFGGAITDAAAYVYSLMDEEQKKQLMTTYFSPERMKYGIVRIHMDSCDFSTEMYEAMSDANDIEMKSFSFARTEKYILPMLEDAQRAAGKPLKLMLSPWSPPSFMKTNGQRTYGGSLKPEYRAMWANYICRYIVEFEKRGYQVQRMSLQNEPKAVQTWDSCIYTAKEEKEFLRDFMYPALKAHGLEHVEIFIWDHNKERVYERICEIVDDSTRDMVAGIAFHWYSGDHFEALELVRNKFCDKKMIISESCIEYSKFEEADVISGALRLSHEIIGDLNHGMTAFYDWNLLLDEHGGPNHVGNFCHAPFLYDTVQKKLMPQLLQQHFEHFSHYLCPGSVRMGYSKYTEQVDVTAYQNPDGKKVVVMLNKSKEILPVNMRMQGEVAEFLLYPESITTGIIE